MGEVTDSEGEGADLGVGTGVQQGQQSDEPLLRVGARAGPAPVEAALLGGFEDRASEAGLCAQP